MYVADVAIWLGWALFYGSIPVLLTALCFAAFIALVTAPSEERQLLAHFGDEYRLYMRSVRRWVGRRHQPTPKPPGA
jgi:protein-S-isoprenylcysteine O-methyltransferase Ste14